MQAQPRGCRVPSSGRFAGGERVYGAMTPSNDQVPEPTRWRVTPSAVGTSTIAVTLTGTSTVRLTSSPSTDHSEETRPRWVIRDPDACVRPVSGTEIVTSAAPGAVTSMPSTESSTSTATLEPQPCEALFAEP